LSFPTLGRTVFVNVPVYCGGVNVISVDAGPPCTMRADTACEEVHVPPELDVFVSVTTFSLPAGFSYE
jgi:hypothetical protein